MIEIVATQDEMAQQTSILNHSKESDQQGNGDNYQNAHGSTTTLELTAISDDGKQRQYTMYQSHHCRTQAKKLQTNQKRQ